MRDQPKPRTSRWPSIRLHLVTIPVIVLALGCQGTEPGTEPEAGLPTPPPPTTPGVGFQWGAATPESQGMCGTTVQLGCSTTLQQIWNDISEPRHNTKRFIVIRNDQVIYDQGGTEAYPVYSASKGLLGAPTLVHALSECGLGVKDPVSKWLAHGDGARWGNLYPWTNITVEHLATHTSGICDYGNPNSVCRDENPGWQAAYNQADVGGTRFGYPDDAFTIARTKAEQNQEPALAPGSGYEYSNVGHGLLNYVVQSACGQSLTDIFDLSIKQPGMGSPVGTALIQTDDGRQFNQSSGVARWNGLDGAAVLRLAARRGIWDNRNIKPVRYWHEVTKTTGNIAAAAASNRAVVYSNNSRDLWTQSDGHRRLSSETFDHGGNYSTVFLIDPLTSTIIVRQGENNGKGASYLTQNGCAPGWTGTAPTCALGTDWSNNWNVVGDTVGSSSVGPRMKIVEPLQQAFFFPPPFCRMTTAAGKTVDDITDIYDSPSGAPTIDLVAEIQVDPREGAGSSAVGRVEFYQEGETGPQHIGDGTLVAGSSPPRYQLSYSAESHGAAGDIKTYFANCVARSVQDPSKQVPSYSRPVRVRR